MLVTSNRAPRRVSGKFLGALTSLVLLALPLACESSGGSAKSAEPVSAIEEARPQPPSLDFLERVAAGADPSAALPMVVALHGLGDRPESFGHLFDGFPAPVRLIFPRAPDSWGKGWSWFPLGPGAAFEEGLLRSADRVAALVRRLREQRPTQGPVVVTGFSQGGMLSFVLAARHPDLFSAVVPIAGFLPETLRVSLLQTATTAGARPKLVAYHGDADDRIPFEQGRLTVEAFTAAGFDAELRPWPNTGHTIPATMRDDHRSLLVGLVAIARAQLPARDSLYSQRYAACSRGLGAGRRSEARLMKSQRG
jgi:phospholipase/carboxylesterase